MVNWIQLKADLGANWDITIPDDINDVIAGNINNVAGAKPFLVMCVRFVMTDYIKRGITKRLRQAKNVVRNRLRDAQDAYVADHPEFSGSWAEYSNAEMFAMIVPYYPNAEQQLNGVSILEGKARDAKDKIDNLLEQIILATEK